jgi:hypothetical protein
MTPRAALVRAGQMVRLRSYRNGRARAVLVRGVQVAEPAPSDEAIVTALEWRARVALDLLGVADPAGAVECAFDEGVPLKSDAIFYRALAIAAERAHTVRT